MTTPSRERVLSTTLVVFDGCSRRLSRHVSRHMRSSCFFPAVAPADPGHQPGPCGCYGRLFAAARAAGRRQQRAGRKPKRAEMRRSYLYGFQIKTPSNSYRPSVFSPRRLKNAIRGRRGRGADDCKFTTVCPGRCMCRHIEQLWLQRLLSAKSCSCLVMSHDLVPEEDKPWTTVHRVQRQRLRTRTKAGDVEHGCGGRECCSQPLWV